MKPWLATLLVLTALVSAGPAVAAEQHVALAVDNMTCAACPVIVKQALAGVVGVRNVHVSYERRTAVVTYDSRSRMSKDRAHMPARDPSPLENGYWLSSEEHSPRKLVQNAWRAEEGALQPSAGFGSLP
jgi:mercuric ion binding protein